MTKLDQADAVLVRDGFTVVAAKPPVAQPWYVLIVDDDEAVHSATRAVLGRLRFLGRPVEILSAYSRRGAAAILWARDDIALVLLDVAMEEEDSGFGLMREIRDEMRNLSLRIIQRTDAAEAAADPRLMFEYDINDQHRKTDLTAPRLVVTTIAALRDYSDMVARQPGRLGLEHIADEPPSVPKGLTLNGFALTLLQQAAEMLGGEHDGALILPDPVTGEARVAAGIGIFAAAAGLKAASLPPGVAEYVARAMQEERGLTERHLIIRPIRTTMRQTGALLFRPALRPKRDDPGLLDIICTSVGVALDNVHLYRHLLNQQDVLEEAVAARTQEFATANSDLVASQQKLREELRIAGTLQQSILPAEFPSHPRVKGAALMRAARDIGGDFYDIFEFDDDFIGLVVADVSGKGVPAALFMVLVRTILQDVVRDTLSPAKALAETNRRLLARNPMSLFVTILYGVLDTRNGRFTFCSGGHGMPSICRAGGRVEKPALRPSPIVGLLDMARYVEHEETLAPGDSVVMTTDGIEEACNARNEMFGDLRLHNALDDGIGEDPGAMLDRVLRAVEGFVRGTPASDDLTCMVARWEGGRRRDPADGQDW
jgi:serine phosphatase RsbU (regulator of sigma subunit)/CheY-like chemotaxis protein